MNYSWIPSRDSCGQSPRSDADPDDHATQIMRDIARTIIEQRLGPKQLSCAQLSRLANVSPASVRNIEHGRNIPSVTMADDVLRALGYRLAVVEVERC